MTDKKHEEGKPKISLLPWSQVEGAVRVMEEGNKKYTPDSWKEVPDGENKYLDAAMRHLGALVDGEENDPEDGLSHWHHAICCCFFGAWHNVNKKQDD